MFGKSSIDLTIIDLKRIEFSHFDFWAANVLTDEKMVDKYFKECIDDINNRFEILQQNHVNSIEELNKKVEKCEDAIPYKIILIDELYSLLNNQLKEILQKGNTVGYYVIASSQVFPSINNSFSTYFLNYWHFEDENDVLKYFDLEKLDNINTGEMYLIDRDSKVAKIKVPLCNDKL